MRVLCTALPVPSHLRLFVPLALALRRRGHEVTVATHPRAHDVLLCHRVDVVAAGVDLAEFETTGPGGTRPLRTLTAEAFTGHLAATNLVEFGGLVDRVRPDLVIHEDTELAGYLIAEVRGLPHACLSVGAANTVDPDWLRPRLDAHRAVLGLPPEPAGGGMFCHLFLDYLPAMFPFTTYPLANHRSYRFPLPEYPGVAAPGWLAELARQRPLVYVATGTFAEPAAAHLLPAAIEALAALDCCAIVVTGPYLDPGTLSQPGPHMRVVPSVPQALVLPSVDVFVTHGGINSIREAIQCAVPMVVTPITADQPHNAECVTRHGLGESIPAAEVTAANLQAAVRDVMTQPRYARTARMAQQHAAALPDLDTAIDDLELLVG